MYTHWIFIMFHNKPPAMGALAGAPQAPAGPMAALMAATLAGAKPKAALPAGKPKMPTKKKGKAAKAPPIKGALSGLNG